MPDSNTEGRMGARTRPPAIDTAPRRPYNPRQMAGADDVARGRAAPPGVAVGRRRLRRPSGETPPLLREEGWAGLLWVAAGVAVVGGLLAVAMAGGKPAPAGVGILRWAEGIRTTLSVDVAKVLNMLASTGFVLALRWVTIILLVVVRRFRHLTVAFVTRAVVDLFFKTIDVDLPLPSELSPPISIVTGPSHYFFPGAAMVALSVTLFTMIYSLLPTGGRIVPRPRGGTAPPLCAL